MTTPNLHKAAVFLMSLPADKADALLKNLDGRQASAVAAEMQRLRSVDRSEQAAIAQELAAAKTKAARPKSPAQRPFQFLRDLSGGAISRLVADEYPQTIALVLSYLPPRQAALVLAALSPDQQLAVTFRIATMEQPNPEIVQDVESTLQSRMSLNRLAGNADRGLPSVVRMLHVMKPTDERKLLGELAAADPDLAWEIRCAMFGPDVAARYESAVADAVC